MPFWVEQSQFGPIPDQKSSKCPKKNCVYDQVFEEMSPFVINFGFLSNASSKTPGIPPKLDFSFLVNPLTPALTVTCCDKRWPLFHLWPKLASSVLKFCRRKRSYQWYPDQSEIQYPQKCSEIGVKNQEQNCLRLHNDYSMVKFARLDDAFSEFVWTGSKPSMYCRRSITAAKR